MVSILAEVVSAAASAVLLIAGTRKVGAPRAIADTVVQLGIRPSYRWYFAVGLGVVEVGVAVGIVFLRGWGISVAVALLALLFAGAGLLAITRSVDVDCNCLGVGTSRLGSRQIWALLLWAPVVLLPTIDSYVTAGIDLRRASFIVVIAAAVVVYLRQLLPLVWQRRWRGVSL